MSGYISVCKDTCTTCNQPFFDTTGSSAQGGISTLTFGSDPDSVDTTGGMY